MSPWDTFLGDEWNAFFGESWDMSSWDVQETEEVKRKRRELAEATRKAMVELREKREEETKALAQKPSLLSVFPMETEAAFRAALERYAKKHPDETVAGYAADRPNYTYRSVTITRRSSRDDAK